MQETLEEVLSLQRAYSYENTPEMIRRGVLVRHSLRDQILEHGDALRAALGGYGSDLAAGGRDGTGRKAEVPWTRVFSRSKAPTPRDGWYVVYLFHPDASGVSICLSHGSTTFEDGGFHGKSEAEVNALMSWAGSALGNSFDDDPSVKAGIVLGSGDLAKAYERTTVFSKFYPTGRIPTDGQLAADLERFAGVLARLYRAQDLGLAPGAPGPEAQQAIDAAEAIAAPLRKKPSGQGRGPNPAARKAIELHAMIAAREWLRENDFTFEDVSATQSCDFRAVRAGQEWIVEVKGTTGGPSSILITAAEVALHRAAFPHNILLVVHGISLAADGYSTSGGALIAHQPWQLDAERLHPISYEYRF